MQLHGKRRMGERERTGECKVHREEDQETEKFRQGQSWSPFCPRRKAGLCPATSWFHRTTIEFASELLGLDSSLRNESLSHDCEIHQTISSTPSLHPFPGGRDSMPRIESIFDLDFSTDWILSLNELEAGK